MNRMYRENRISINAWVGCHHNCIYCIPSFQRQMKRVAGRIGCNLCARYEPHYHPERLHRPPKTEGDEFIFFPSSGDLAFAPRVVVEDHIKFAKAYLDRTFLIQSKAPSFFLEYDFPKNVILGTTVETNKVFFDTPSKYQSYFEISKAPLPSDRMFAMAVLEYERKMVTIEPILDFNTDFLIAQIHQIAPKIVYVGYDNHKCKLPEPRMENTLKLIEELKKFTEVRTKTIRKAWYEE